MNYEEWLEKANTIIESKIQSGKSFEVKQLFPGHEWEKLSRGDRIGFGRYFSMAVKEGRFPSIEKCGEGKTHHNVYIKL